MNKKLYFSYGEKEIAHLKAKDPLLGNIIDSIGEVNRPIIPDLFEALINSILGQQISTKAADTVWERFLTFFSPVSPIHISSFSAEELQTCGITLRKAGYIKEISTRIANGTFDLQELKMLPDEEVCTRLCKLPGIGIWTAEMLMLHSMQRQNILSFGDLAIVRGLRMLYHHREITPKLFAKYKRRYSPHASVASIYLWAISAGAVNVLKDPASSKTKRKK
ncbi:DNA-3-methyladenine glycosylase [Clostridium puniceum]|uniref:DNA-3-methyladenine glycosylase II n=1 Tax=Clostridium puniceum TaxID=29367 RepID=A0A1S8SYK9_9CLOT|nr:DNA-3-methyladenine glycosylase [Clostridium puniceum]OOM70586.1 DNA-3-methyladenine glycosylase [Clostridium puniceum]